MAGRFSLRGARTIRATASEATTRSTAKTPASDSAAPARRTAITAPALARRNRPLPDPVIAWRWEGAQLPAISLR